MFQYAIGRVLALKNNTVLKLDIADTFVNADRPYRLDVFSISATPASPQDTAAFTGWRKILSLLWGSGGAAYIRERSMQFDPTALQATGTAYLDGYWQSERYFKKNAHIIREDFTVRAKPTGLNKSLLQQIASTQAVCLHVRRGDYVESKIASLSHGTCSLDYYQQAIKLIAQKVLEPHFFVFSDDPAWVKKNLQIGHSTTHVSHNQNAPEEDLRLMSRCQHFIIANSTFSWWGAWLADNPKKIVIAPKQWFRTLYDDRDLVPKEWVRL